eukprot:TRINITY_DN5329_c1_g1_i1.p1 TRINITY_DN5329_c1_g1~~TRINITY_DN5329_c1_g1_i1.p1  ORF type:complete len:267 (-),score=103.06 TRINITY_DN5329_c1_g1_i1:91-891(-)
MKTLDEYEQGFLQLFNLDSSTPTSSTLIPNNTFTPSTSSTTLKSSLSSPTSSPTKNPSPKMLSNQFQSSPILLDSLPSSPILQSYTDSLFSDQNSTPNPSQNSSHSNSNSKSDPTSMCYSCGNTRINVNCSTRRCQPCCAKSHKPCRLTAHAEAKSRLNPNPFSETVKEIIGGNKKIKMRYGESAVELELEGIKWVEGHEGFMFVGKEKGEMGKEGKGEEKERKYRVDRIVGLENGKEVKEEEGEEGEGERVEGRNKRKRGASWWM